MPIISIVQKLLLIICLCLNLTVSSQTIKIDSTKKDSTICLKKSDYKWLIKRLTEHYGMTNILDNSISIMKKQDSINMTLHEMLLLRDSKTSILELENLRLQGELKIQYDYYNVWYRKWYVVLSSGIILGYLIAK